LHYSLLAGFTRPACHSPMSTTERPGARISSIDIAIHEKTINSSGSPAKDFALSVH
jgi:hypothetical protein